MKKLIKNINFACLGVVLLLSCQKFERPVLGDYPSDTPVTPTTALRFFVPFDSTKAEAKQINIRFADSISNYPSFFPDKSITYGDGVHGTAFNSVKGAHLNYINSNDFVKSTSITVAFWMKREGSPVGDAQFGFSIPTTVGHWSNATMFLLFDHSTADDANQKAILKFFILDSKGEKWFELVNNDRMPNIYDNQWHHLAFAYNEANSTMSFYRDGVLHKDIDWAGHGPLTIDATKVSGFRLGGKTTDWGTSFVGGIDQFRLYNKALTAGEVKELFDGRK